MKNFLTKLNQLSTRESIGRGIEMFKIAEMSEMEYVDSSNIESIGFDPEASILQVQFKGGSIYQYENVPAEVFEEFKAADSKGTYLSRNIKGIYAYTKIS